MKEIYLKQRLCKSVCTKKKSGVINLAMLLLFLLNLNLTWANGEELQQRKVTGTVTDSKTGEALPGVNITIQGSGPELSLTLSDSIPLMYRMKIRCWCFHLSAL